MTGHRPQVKARAYFRRGVTPATRVRHLGAIRLAILMLGLRLTSALSSQTNRAPQQDYLVFVVESADKIVRIRFGPNGAKIGNQAHIGLIPTDINGPHGIAVSPDKRFIYVANANFHGDMVPSSVSVVGNVLPNIGALLFDCSSVASS